MCVCIYIYIHVHTDHVCVSINDIQVDSATRLLIMAFVPAARTNPYLKSGLSKSVDDTVMDDTEYNMSIKRTIITNADSDDDRR